MKIVLTAHQFLPDHASGTEIIAYDIARELRSRGHSVVIVTGYPARAPMADDERFDEYVYDGFRVVRFHHADVPMAGLDNVIEGEYSNRLFHRFFSRWLADFAPDLVHFVHLGRLTASAVEACRDAGIPSVFTATDFWMVCPTNQLRLPDGSMCAGPRLGAANCVKHIALVSQPAEVRRTVSRMPVWALGLIVLGVRRGWLRRQWYAGYVRALSARPSFLRARARELAAIIVPSRIMRDMLVRNGMPAERLVTLPYGIDLRHIQRNTERGTTPTLRVAFVGTLAEHKGPHVLLEAVRQLPADLPIEVRLHGRTDEFPEYVDRLQALIGADPRSQLAGRFRRDQVGDVLAGTDVLVCPSLWYENTPLVIYEAMAAGIPVVATDLGGMSEAVEDGVSGLLFRRGNAAELASHLRRLAEDRAFLRQLAARTRPPMTVPQHVDRLEQLYLSVVPARAARDRVGTSA